MDRRTRRDGRAIEELGHYDPNVANTDGATPSYKLNEERAKYWLSQGAQVSETVASFLKSSGIDIVAARKG
jgi:small subunit ribosomal protein S16